jgi:hypothetical protein
MNSQPTVDLGDSDKLPCGTVLVDPHYYTFVQVHRMCSTKSAP